MLRLRNLWKSRIRLVIIQVSFYFLVLSCLITLNVCVFYRHQAVLPYDHWLKLGKVPFSFIQCWIVPIIQKQRIFLYSQYAIITQLMTVFTYFAEHESTGRSEYLEKVCAGLFQQFSPDHWVFNFSHSLLF